MIRNFFLIAFILIGSSCSPFGKNINTNASIADGLTPKELYAIAEDKLNSGSIDQAIDQYRIILASYPTSKYAIQSRLDIAFNLYKRKKYKLAIIELDNFISIYPSIEATPYAYYLRGIIAEDKSTSILDNLVTDSAQRDVQSIKEAYGYFLELIDIFPDSKYSKDASEKLEVLTNILARHELYIAIYYTENSSNIAAINRTKYIIENYPNSFAVADSLNLMAFNYDQIGALKLAADARTILKSTYKNYSPSYKLK
jgi:outer membrane protein assembly factor BamD